MFTNEQIVIYLIANAFGTFTIFKFISIYFNRAEVNKKRELMTYLFYYVIISSVYLFWNKPLLTMSTNILLFIILTLNYEATWKKRLLTVLFIYIVFLSAEGITVLVLNLLGIYQYSAMGEINYTIAQVGNRIVSFMIVLLLSNIRLLKEGVAVPLVYWIAAIAVPICTMFPTFILMIISAEKMLYLRLFSIILLFGINILVFYMYDSITKLYQDKLDKELLRQQNNAYFNQLDIILATKDNARIMRHDFEKHLTTMRTYLEQGNHISALAYLENIAAFTHAEGNYVKSGHVAVDSILNYKIQEAKKNGITVQTKIAIAEQLDIAAFDLSAILGNLMDNALEATQKLEKDRLIKVIIELDKNILHITISNHFSGVLASKKGKLETTRPDRENHGLGLSIVKKAIEKYNGLMQLSNNEQIFVVNIMMYNHIN